MNNDDDPKDSVDPFSAHNKNSHGSLSVSLFLGGGIDGCDKDSKALSYSGPKDMSLEEPESQSDAEKLTAPNTTANTTETKSIKLVNSSPILTIWSYYQITVRYTSAVSVSEFS